MERPKWGDDHDRVRASWALDPAIAHLNHGSFGATPLAVLGAQDEWRARMERDPVEFLHRKLPGLLSEARIEAATFLRADPDELVFVPNATTAVNTVLRALALEPGDEILTTDHAYGAVLNAMDRTTNATVVRAHIPLPLPEPDEIVARVVERITARTRLVIVDQITSATGAIFPAREIVAACAARNVLVMVDAAHAPGQLETDVRAIDADFWTGNFHKWGCAPKGAAVFIAKKKHHDRVRPLVTTHAYYEGWADAFGWTGTVDPSPYLSVPAAIAFMSSLGWERVRAYNNALAAYGRATVAEALGAPQVVPDDAFAAMAIIPLPQGAADTIDAGFALTARLHDEHHIEVPCGPWNGGGFLRVSAQVYNAPEQYDRLAEVLAKLLR